MKWFKKVRQSPDLPQPQFIPYPPEALMKLPPIPHIPKSPERVIAEELVAIRKVLEQIRDRL